MQYVRLGCQDWKMILLSKLDKKCKSKCYQPWKLEKGSNIERAKVSMLRRIVGCWDDMLDKGIFNIDEIPLDVQTAAGILHCEFVIKPCVNDNTKNPINDTSKRPK